MPSATAIVDSSIYIELLRYGHFRRRLEQSPWLIRHSAVVLSELRRGATERRELRWIDQLEASARVFVPGVREWRRSGEILAALRRAKTYDARKLRDLHFEAVRRYDAFDLEVWEAPRNRPDRRDP